MKKAILMCILIMSIFVTACSKNTSKNNDGTIRIASSYGMSYSPFEVMLQLNLIEKIAPNIHVEIITLTGSATMNEAVIAGDIDIAGVGVTTFLIGHDRGVPYKIARALADIELALQTNDPTIMSLTDIRPEHRIAVNSIISTHNILLSMAASNELGNVSAFENQVVVMNHADATMALMNNIGVDLHFTSQPYIFKQNAAGFHTILSESDVMGTEGFTSVVVAVTNNFAENNPELLEIFMQALNEAVLLIDNRNPDAIAIIAKSEGISETEVIELLDSNKVSYAPEVRNMLSYSELMQSMGYIENELKSMDEVLWK